MFTPIRVFTMPQRILNIIIILSSVNGMGCINKKRLFPIITRNEMYTIYYFRRKIAFLTSSQIQVDGVQNGQQDPRFNVTVHEPIILGKYFSRY